MSEVAEAKRIQVAHKKWIVGFLRDNGGEVTSEAMFKMGDEKHCDTLAALLFSMKKAKIIDYPGVMLMATASSNAKIIKLTKPDYNPDAEL